MPVFRVNKFWEMGQGLSCDFKYLWNMGLFSRFSRTGKNKEFGYAPRYYDDGGQGSPFKLEHRFDKFRSTVDVPRGLKGKFNHALKDFGREGDRNLRLRFLVILAILVLIFLYIIDFDLSIFLND